MVHVSPRDMERFYLRLMLCHCRGPTSFEDLRTVNNQMYPTYHDAAKAAGHLDNDGEWIACMEEAKGYQMPYQLRQLFATLLVYSMPSDVRGMWDQFYKDLSADYAHKYREMIEPAKSEKVLFKTLLSLQQLLEVSGYAVSNFDLPVLNETLLRESHLENSLIRRELTSYDESDLEDIVSTEDHLNEGQRKIYDQIIGAVNQPEAGKKLFFIDGPG